MSSSAGEKKRKIGVDEASDIVFEYTGNGQIVPKNVVDNVIHVRFHPSVIEVEEKAFMDCIKVKVVVMNDGLNIIGDRAFWKCYSLQSINIPSSVTKINSWAFYWCKCLREVVLNEGLREIGGKAFCECTSIERITTPSTVVEIGEFAFMKCVRLRELVFSEGMKKIGFNALEGCTSLENISIPSTVVEIGNYAFSGCSNLREVVIHNEEIQIGGESFLRCTSLERFKFPGLSTRLDNIIQAGQRDIEAKMDGISAVEWRSGELTIPVVHREIENRLWGMEIVIAAVVDEEKLNKIIRLIRHYEMKEATTLFELALWKATIDQADNDDNIDRIAHRIEVPGPVKDTILQYLR